MNLYPWPMWSKAKSYPTTPTEYPQGTFVKSEKGYFYIVSDSKRYRISSSRVLKSWRPHRVVKTTEKALVKYRVAAKMKFRPGTLIHSLTDGSVYLIVGGKRCRMVSPEAFEKLGVARNSKHIVTVSKEELEMHELGDDIS